MIQIKIGNCRKLLKEIPRKSIQSTITSPPYYGLRDYGTASWVGGDPNCPHKRLNKQTDANITGHGDMNDVGSVVGDAIYKSVCPLCGAVREDEQIGLEETPEEYVANLVEVFREVRETLSDDGTLWLNLGDSYCGTGHKKDKKDPKHKDGRNGQYFAVNNKIDGLKQKDLIGIPWMVAFALRNDGWYLRQDIIWHKPNPMPEPVRDRCTKSHEYIFLLSKSRNYYFDYKAIEEEATGERWAGNEPMDLQKTKDRDNVFSGLTRERQMLFEKRRKRSVWKVNPANLKDAHFATFPEKLILPMVLATTIPGETILDPFAGSGTTGLVAGKHNRDAILIELNPDYKKIIDKRLEGDLFFTAETEVK